MQFAILENKNIEIGTLYYNKEFYSFEFHSNSGNYGVFSLLVNDLSLEVNEENILLYVDGLCPYTVWVDKKIVLPTYTIAVIKIADSENILAIDNPGTAKRITQPNEWVVTHDKDIGWICLGSNIYPSSCIAIEFSEGQVAVLDEGELISLLIKVKT